jgi:hypothetical protein
MQHSPLFLRISLIVLTGIVAFGLGAATSRAFAAYPSCTGICESQCEGHDGCQTSYVDIDVCLYWCMDGCHGEVYMGK